MILAPCKPLLGRMLLHLELIASLLVWQYRIPGCGCPCRRGIPWPPEPAGGAGGAMEADEGD